MNNWTVIKKNNKTYLVHKCRYQKYESNTSFKVANRWYCLCCYKKAPSNMNLCAELCYCSPVTKLTIDSIDIFLKQFIALVDLEVTQGYNLAYPIYGYEWFFSYDDLLYYYEKKKAILRDVIKEEQDYIKKTFQLK